MFKKEITEDRAFKELYQFGTKCYKKGYRRAVVDMYVGIGFAVMALVSMGMIEKLANRDD